MTALTITGQQGQQGIMGPQATMGFATDAAYLTWATANSVTVLTGYIYYNTTSLKLRIYGSGNFGDYDASATASAAAAAGSLTAINSAIGTANSIPSALASPFTLDGYLPSAIMSFEKGLFSLNGAIVPYTSLFTFSGVAKYVVKADGSYGLSTANTPAYDWSNGRKRVLIEVNAATNLMLNSEGNLATYSPYGGTVVSAGTSIAGFGASVSFPDNTVSSFTYKQISVTTGVSYTLSWFIQMNDNSVPVVAGNLSTSDCCLIFAGSLFTPDAITLVGNNIYRVSKTYTATSTGLANFGMVKYTTCSAKAFSVTGYQLEVGSLVSSYILTTTATATRTADVVTSTAAFTALLNAANSTMVIRGRTLMPAGTTGVPLGSSTGGGVFYSVSGGAAIWNHGQVSGLAAPVTASAEFGFCVGASQTGRKAVVNGGAVASDAITNQWAAEAYYFIGQDPGPYLPTNMYFHELVVWPFYGSNTGTQAQARIYA